MRGDFLPSVIKPRYGKISPQQNVFTTLILLLQLPAFICFTIAITTDYWNYDPQSDYHHSLWRMYRCASFDLSSCVEIQVGENARILTLQILAGFSYSFQIISLLHSMIQYFFIAWYTKIQAIISVVILTTSAITFIIGFAVYFQRNLVSNFALHIVLGFSAHVGLASIAISLIVIGLYGIEISRRCLKESNSSSASVAVMKSMVISGPPPKRKLAQGAPPSYTFAQAVATVNEILAAGERLKRARQEVKKPRDSYDELVQHVNEQQSKVQKVTECVIAGNERQYLQVPHTAQSQKSKFKSSQKSDASKSSLKIDKSKSRLERRSAEIINAEKLYPNMESKPSSRSMKNTFIPLRIDDKKEFPDEQSPLCKGIELMVDSEVSSLVDLDNY